METRYNVTGEKRKEMVEVVSGVIGMKAIYMRMPTCAYAISNIIVSKDGTLVWDGRTDSRTIRKVKEALAAAGFTAEEPETAQEAAETAPEETTENGNGKVENGTQGESVGLTVAMPLDKVNTSNLTSLLDAKGHLIQKALGIDATPIEITEEAVSFPWFSELPEPDAVKAYTHLISALCGMSVGQKRITAKEKPVDNEKYAFRCFLLRLGFIGEEYKTERKILLKNLTGSSAFKSGARKEAGSDGISV